MSASDVASLVPADSGGRAMPNCEPVRLVVWDLDDTFWQGTLSEGGIEAYLQQNHDIVIELARRGIMSSICSKNDFATVRKLLEERGIWDYFIFPSIDWTAKGQRVAAIVDMVQLRPPTILFVDDNPMNLAEVAAAVKDIQTATPSILADILKNPLFKGKDNSSLTRLNQYKLLEKRGADMMAAPGGDEAFLRGANVRVYIEADVLSHLDRAIELINRTNQLNFTKRRLPEQIDAARAELASELRPYYVRTGLVRVIDNYGDYGYCGFFRAEANMLVDYCFSCRILGMGVKSWLYDRLGRPSIMVVGEVLTDLSKPRNVDWITLLADDEKEKAHAVPSIPEVRLRGGCDLDVLAHYFQLAAGTLRSETNRSRGPLFVRMDNSVQLLPALGEVDAGFNDATAQLGFDPSDFASEFLAPAQPGTILVYSAWADVYQVIYRHKIAGYRIPINVNVHTDLTQITDEQLAAALDQTGISDALKSQTRDLVATLRRDYMFESYLTPEDAVDILRRIFARIPDGARLFMILPHEWYMDGGVLQPRPSATEYNRAVKEIARDYPAVELIPIDELVGGAQDMQDSFDHFDRIVYLRAFQWILRRTESAKV